MELVLDIDFAIFAAASVSQDRYITATHRPTGEVFEFKTRTELWGHHTKKVGGAIGMKNDMEGTNFYKSEDFDVEDGQRLREFKIKADATLGTTDHFISPLDGAKKILDDTVARICRELGATSYRGFTGEGKVFRHDMATLMPYKGERDEMLTPLLLKELKAYAISRHNITLVTGIEADDAVSMATIEGYNAWVKGGRQDEDMVVAVAVDKDAKQTQGWHYNPDKDSSPRLIEGLGRLWLDAKDEVDGCGRMWLYYQMCAGDSTDGYKPNCYSKLKYASKGAYKDLVDATTDKEAFSAMVKVFKKLYPEPLQVETFRGTLQIDWMYVMQEMADMAMMLRKPNDRMVVRDVLVKLNLE